MVTGLSLSIRLACIALSLQGCGRVGFDARGTGQDAATSDGGKVGPDGAVAVMNAQLMRGTWGADLTADGPIDWIHFGLGALGARNRKQGVTPQISDYEHVGGGVLSQEVGAGTTLSWTDGTPTATATNVPDCEIIDTPNPSGDAFRITIAAGATPRQITFYIGNW
jgi:hypothetical protein